MSRANEGFAQTEEQKNSDLRAAGIAPGTEAYDREMQRIDEARNDYRLQAEGKAGAEVSRDFGMDSELRRQQIAEMLAGRQTPLNEITALMSGSQVSNPFSQASVYNGGATAAAAPLFQGAQAQGQAANDLYNAQAGMYGNTLSGLFGMGGAFLGNKGLFGG